MYYDDRYSNFTKQFQQNILLSLFNGNNINLMHIFFCFSRLQQLFFTLIWFSLFDSGNFFSFQQQFFIIICLFLSIIRKQHENSLHISLSILLLNSPTFYILFLFKYPALIIVINKMLKQGFSLAISTDQNSFWAQERREPIELWKNISFGQIQQPIHEQFFQHQVTKEPKIERIRKKRKAKFSRESGKLDSKDRRDIQKYAKLDACNLILKTYLEKMNKSQKQICILSKAHKVSKRSLRYFFIALGVLKREGQLQNYLKFFRQNIQQTITTKYWHRSLFFKTLLSDSLHFSQHAVQLILQNKDLDGIQLAYMLNKQGVKGKTKNPLEMELCRDFYSKIFPSHCTSQPNNVGIYLQ